MDDGGWRMDDGGFEISARRWRGAAEQKQWQLVDHGGRVVRKVCEFCRAVSLALLNRTACIVLY